MACGKCKLEIGVLKDGINAAFSAEYAKELKESFDKHRLKPKTTEQVAEIQAGKDRLQRIRERVAERQRQRAQSDGSGR